MKGGFFMRKREREPSLAILENSSITVHLHLLKIIYLSTNAPILLWPPLFIVF